MANEICPECFEGIHGQCIEQGCYCDCQLEEYVRVGEKLAEEGEFDVG